MITMEEKAPKIYAQLAAIMAEAEAVGKNRDNEQQKFKFRGIQDVMDSLHPIFAKNKVFILSEITDQKTEERATRSGGSLIYRILTVRISYVSGIDGSRETMTVVGEGMDSGDKAANKAMSAALKYALTQTLILPYAAIDADQETPPESTPKKDEPKTKPAPAGLKNATSAHDGRKLEPTESALPKPTAAPADAGAFNSRLYDMLTLSGVTADELTAYLRKKGLMTSDQGLDNLAKKFVNAMLDGTDKKTNEPNWDIITRNIQKGRK